MKQDSTPLYLSSLKCYVLLNGIEAIYQYTYDETY